jgi:hypothetical protein
MTAVVQEHHEQIVQEECPREDIDNLTVNGIIAVKILYHTCAIIFLFLKSTLTAIVQTGVKEMRPSQLLSTITLEELKPYLALPMHQVQKTIGIGRTSLKKHCRRLGIPYWPGREERSIAKKNIIVNILYHTCAIIFLFLKSTLTAIVQTGVKKMRPSQLLSTITLEELKPYLALPMHQVEKTLGISHSSFRRHCRRLGIPFWPGRKHKSRKNKVTTCSALATINQEAEDISDWVKPIKKDPNAVEGSPPLSSRKHKSRKNKVSTCSALATINQETEDISDWARPIKKEPE